MAYQALVTLTSAYQACSVFSLPNFKNVPIRQQHSYLPTRLVVFVAYQILKICQLGINTHIGLLSLWCS